MSSGFNFMKLFAIGRSVKKSNAIAKSRTYDIIKRNFADTTKPDSTSKQVVVQGTENEARLRVRRARPADVPRVLRFVRDNAPHAWPGLVTNAPSPNKGVLLADYVTRTLSQGHSMLAEQQEAKRGWTQIRGLALSTAVCPWDAVMLEKWARCVRCSRFRKLMLFTAHCLRAPGLHDKYRVHNILQVVLMVPPDSPRSAEIIHMLTKNSIQRGRDVGYPVLRFDVTTDIVAKVLCELQLKKEWEFNYEVLPNSINVFSTESNIETPKEKQNEASETEGSEEDKNETKGRYIAVFTAFPHTIE